MRSIIENLDDARRLRLQTLDAGLEFLRQELSLATTFLMVAQSSRDQKRRARNLQFARRACEVAGQFLDRLDVPEQDRLDLRQTMDKVLALLDETPDEPLVSSGSVPSGCLGQRRRNPRR